MIDERQKILIVDDERQIRRFLHTGLDAHGYEVLEATSGHDALRQIATLTPHLVVLDLGLPDMDGIEVLQTVRAWSAVPVLILSVRSREGEKVHALETGADDYITKPFGMPEFVARVKSALRRSVQGNAPQPIFIVGNLEVDLGRRVVRVDGKEIRLTPKEYRLLQVLVGNAGKVVTHQQLLREVWGTEHTDDVHYLRMFVRMLRKHLEPEPARPRYLLTELGVGYRLRSPEQLEHA
jgi:two-component system KDP operon response regulator KdpE